MTNSPFGNSVPLVSLTGGLSCLQRLCVLFDCCTIPTKFDFDPQQFTSGVYRRSVLVTRPSILWNGARSVEQESLEDEYDDNSTIRTSRDAEMIRDQATVTSIQTDTGAFETQY